MYEEHWNLTTEPFDQRIEPQFYYPSESHQAALLKLSYAIETRRAAAVLCGDSGTGKSMLVESCIEQLPETISPIVRVPYPFDGICRKENMPWSSWTKPICSTPSVPYNLCGCC